MIDFPVNIERKTVGVSERGFGTILILDNTQDLNYRVISYEDILDLDSNSKLYKIATRLFMQKPVPQEVAIFGKLGSAEDALRAILEENSDWFYLTCTDNSIEAIKAMSELIVVNNKMYAVTVNDYSEAVKISEVFDNTFVMFHDDSDSYVAEGLAVIMSYNVGGKTAKFKNVIGVKAANVTLTELQELEDRNIFTYVEKLGVLQTTEGKVLSGEYIDIVLGEYWIRFRMEEELQRLALINDKIPYTNLGIGMIVGAVDRVLTRAVDQGIIEDGQYKIDYKLREDVASNEVALRKYNYVSWTAMLQGAIHTGQISGVVTYDIQEVSE